MRTVAIIGTGPAAMLAGWAVLQHGEAVIAFFHPPDAPMRSVIHGAQYIHGEIDDLPGFIQPFVVTYRHFGMEAGYRHKIYGRAMDCGGTSWSTFADEEQAWPMVDIYDYLLDQMLGLASFYPLAVDDHECEIMVDTFDYVFNTAPLNKISNNGEFVSEKVFIAPLNLYRVPNNEIQYYGDDRLAYRASNILGAGSTEFPSRIRREMLPGFVTSQLKEIHKPLRCEGVELPGVYRLGRYGKWRKGVLAHHVYEEVLRILERNLPWTASLPA